MKSKKPGWPFHPRSSAAVSCSPVSNMGVAFLLLVLYFVAATEAQLDVHSNCTLAPSPRLTPFVEPLPIPQSINISTGAQLTLGAYKINQSVHPELPNTTFYAYGTSQETATYPGPTLEARVNVTSFVRFENHITDREHMFTVDRTLHHADPPNGGVPISTHFHGGEVDSKYDGHPEAWHTAFNDTGPKFVTKDNVYPNEQVASLMWYHDHTVGYTRLSVVAGLAGLYILRGGEEHENLPEGEFEVPLVIQDKVFFPNGSINFPDTGFSPYPNWCPDYNGDTILVNGKAWPYLNVSRNMYRFRILNGANARGFSLRFSDSRVQFLQIGTDGGFLWGAPLPLTDLFLSPAYRVDVLVDFSKVPVGTVVYLNNTAPATEAPVVDGRTTTVMKFNVVAEPRPQDVLVPTSLGPAPDVDSWIPGAAYRRVNLNIIPPTNVSNITFLIEGRHFSENVTETPRLYTREIWDITTRMGEPAHHPMHIHLVNFIVIHKQSFNLTRLDNRNCTLDQPFPQPDSCFTEAPQAPTADQVGWKDTVVVRAATVVRLMVPIFPRVGLTFPFDPTGDAPGYVFHCHNLNHEDNDMMRPLQFLPPA